MGRHLVCPYWFINCISDQPLFLYRELKLQSTFGAVGGIDVAAVELHCMFYNSQPRPVPCVF